MSRAIDHLHSYSGFSLRECCEELRIHRSSFYYWSRRKGDREKEQQEQEERIKKAFEKSKGCYGYRRIRVEVNKESVTDERSKEGGAKSPSPMGEKTVLARMRNMGLQGKHKKAFRPQTTINNPQAQKATLVFNIRETKLTREDQVWGSDMTYLYLKGIKKPFYFVVVMCLFTRQIKGWTLSDNMKAVHTKEAIINAVANAKNSLKGTIFHSDQGTQYGASEVCEILEILGMIQSMSRKGNCYDNAMLESYFRGVKNELNLEGCHSQEDLSLRLFAHIQYYNKERLHSSLGYMSPLDFAKKHRKMGECGGKHDC